METRRKMETEENYSMRDPYLNAFGGCDPVLGHHCHL